MMARNAAIILAHLIVYVALSFSILQYLRSKGVRRRVQVEIFALLTGGALLSLLYSIGLLAAPWWLPPVGLFLFWIAMQGLVYSVTKYISLAAFIWSQILCASGLVLAVLSPLLMHSARDNGWNENSLTMLAVLLWVVVLSLLSGAMILAARASWKHRDRWLMRWPPDG